MTFDDGETYNDEPMQTQKQKPEHEVRIGLIKAGIWKNEGENGARYNVTFRRMYKDGKAAKDEPWKFTDTFGRDDLLTLAKVADLAHSWIFEQSKGHEEEKATNQRR